MLYAILEDDYGFKLVITIDKVLPVIRLDKPVVSNGLVDEIDKPKVTEYREFELVNSDDNLFFKYKQI